MDNIYKKYWWEFLLVLASLSYSFEWYFVRDLSKNDFSSLEITFWRLFFDKNWRILLLEPTYKDNWEIPGGIIEENESPKEACEREIKEELWLDIQVWKLLCLEYQREEDDSYMFIFNGGVLSENDINNIEIQESEIKNFYFLNLEEMSDKVLPKMLRRIKKWLEASRNNATIYYETIYDA